MGIAPSSRRNSRLQAFSRRDPPETRSTHFYQQGYRNGQYLMRLPQHGFSVTMTPPPVPHVIFGEYQKATTIRNDVNLKKATLKLEKDEENPGYHLVSFSFDAAVPGSICVFFLAREGVNCSLTPLKPHMYKPRRVTFDKGLGQQFRQMPGMGVNLSLFEPEDLSKGGQDDVYFLVVRTESMPKELPADVGFVEPVGAPLPKWIHSQTTHAAIQRKDDGQYQVRVVKQIIWVDGVRYEQQEIYGIGTGDQVGLNDRDSSKECVICLSELRDTAMLPCRHLCMCSECAKVLRFQTNRCPICRCPVEQLLEIRVPKNDDE